MSRVKEGRHYQRRHEWSERQEQVFDLLVKGYTNREIAQTLGISLDGAKYHVSELITRLGVETREQAADYWRQRKSVRGRVRSAARAISAPLVLRWTAAGGGAVLLAGIVAAVAVVLLQDGDGQEAAAPDVTPTVVATPPATPDDGNNDEITEIGGVPVQPLEIGEETELPRGAVLYYVRDQFERGHPHALTRAHLDESGEIVERPILAELVDAGEAFHSMAIRPDGSELIAQSVTGGPDDQALHTYVSTDGGVTWELHEPGLPYSSSVIGFRGDEWIVHTIPGGRIGYDDIGEDDTNNQSVWLYPSGRELSEDIDTHGYTPVTDQQGEHLYWRRTGPVEGPRYLNADGEPVFEDIDNRLRETLELVTERGHGIFRGSALPDGGAPTYLVEVEPDGTVLSAFMWPTANVGIVQELTDSLLLGTALYPSGQPDSHAAPGHPDFRPVFIDVETGALHSIADLPREFTDDTNTASYPVKLVPRGRAAIQVDTGGSCLNVREGPSTDEDIIRCYVDGVLLFEREADEDVDGWLPVRTPDGREGWAADEFVVR